MRRVLDTNVVVSGLIWNGPPRGLLDLAASSDIALFSSTFLLEELADVLARRKSAASLASRGLTATFLTQRYGAVTTLVFTARADRTVPADADDDHAIAAAVRANADAVATGDRHLLALEPYKGILPDNLAGRRAMGCSPPISQTESTRARTPRL